MIKKRFFKTKDECEITFEFNAPEANNVALMGDFNNWEPVPMKKAKAAKAPFRTKVRVPKEGQFQFRYLINGETWENDEAADAYWANGYDADNSVVFTFSNN
jgi:1,4-alpha-glucan branching enzyme